MSELFTATLPVQSEDETEALARRLALWARPGFGIRLSGVLGSGKSVLARAFIRAVAQDPELEVPSPTFSILQSYDDLRVPIAHADLYRLADVAETRELGLEELAATHVLLLEWPERAGGAAFSANVLDITLEGSGSGRSITLTGHGGWARLLARDRELADFLAVSGYGQHERRFFQGDASTRRYETLEARSGRVLLMDMPERSDFNIVKDGKSYSALVHLADSIDAVLAINAYLHKLGYSVPETYAADPARGFAAMEFLEGEVHGAMMLRGDDMSLPLSVAAEALADIAGRSWPSVIPAYGGGDYRIPDFDIDALVFETDLMPAWFWPQLHGAPAPESVRQSFEAVWRGLLPAVLEGPKVWTLRDYHSPNLIWMPQRKGLNRTGMIDTQDAVMGNPAYDLASLLQDARVDVAPEMQARLLAHYLDVRAGTSGFARDVFLRDYAILGAQRASRLLGTFTRLSKRDGKHQYLKHRPRVARYLVQNLMHPELASLRRWYETHLPDVLALAKS